MQVSVKQITLALLLLGSTAAKSQMLQVDKKVVVSASDAKVIEKAEEEIKRADPALYGGRPIKPGELPFSVYLGNCTASITGPNTLITAGHCRSTGSSAAFSQNNIRYSGTCTRHPDYNRGGNTNNDFAFCRFSPSIDLPAYARISSKTLSVGDKLIMQGYGAGSNGVLNVGESVVYDLDDQDIITKTSVSLGGGDSGGGLFLGPTDLIKGPFDWVGVNSRRQIGGNRSFFNRADLDRSQKFFKDWAEKQGVQVCGVNWDCYGTTPPPPGICLDEIAVVNHLEKLLGDAKQRLQMCQAASR